MGAVSTNNHSCHVIVQNTYIHLGSSQGALLTENMGGEFSPYVTNKNPIRDTILRIRKFHALNYSYRVGYIRWKDVLMEINCG